MLYFFLIMTVLGSNVLFQGYVNGYKLLKSQNKE